MATPEGKVKDAVKKRLHAHGVYPFMKVVDMDPASVRGIYWMPVQGPFAVQGVHDFVGVWGGVPFSIETKAPNNPQDATENQQSFQYALSLAGGVSLIGVRSADAVDELSKRIQEMDRL